MGIAIGSDCGGSCDGARRLWLIVVIACEHTVCSNRLEGRNHFAFANHLKANVCSCRNHCDPMHAHKFDQRTIVYRKAHETRFDGWMGEDVVTNCTELINDLDVAYPRFPTSGNTKGTNATSA